MISPRKIYIFAVRVHHLLSMLPFLADRRWSLTGFVSRLSEKGALSSKKAKSLSVPTWWWESRNAYGHKSIGAQPLIHQSCQKKVSSPTWDSIVELDNHSSAQVMISYEFPSPLPKQRMIPLVVFPIIQSNWIFFFLKKKNSSNNLLNPINIYK